MAKPNETPKKHAGLSGQMSSNPDYDPNLKSNLQGQVGQPGISPEKAAAEFEKLRQKLDGFKKAVLKKYKFTRALALLPPNASALFEEDEAVPQEVVKT